MQLQEHFSSVVSCVYKCLELISQLVLFHLFPLRISEQFFKEMRTLSSLNVFDSVCILSWWHVYGLYFEIMSLVFYFRADKPHYIIHTETATIKNEWCVDFCMAKLALGKIFLLSKICVWIVYLCKILYLHYSLIWSKVFFSQSN